jgi:hypothetical protein
MQPVRSLDHAVDAFYVNRQALGLVTDPAITGCAVEFLHPWRLTQFPNECVFATATAEYEDFHG